MGDAGNAWVTVTRTDRAGVVCTVHGDVDQDTRAVVTRELLAAVTASSPPDVVVIDLSAVAFLAAAGLHVLGEVAAVCSERRVPVRLVSAPGACTTRVLQLCPPGGDVPVFGSVADALALGQAAHAPQPSASAVPEPLHRFVGAPALPAVAGPAWRSRPEQAIIDAEMRASRRAILALFRRRLRTDVATLVAPDFLVLADEPLVFSAITTAAFGVADACDVQTYDPVTRSLQVVAQRGLPRAFVEHVATLDVTAGSAAGVAARTGEPVLVDGVAASRVFDGQPTREVLLAAGSRAVHSYPLHDDHRRLRAVLSLHYHSAGRHPGQELLAWYAEQALSRVALPFTLAADAGQLMTESMSAGIAVAASDASTTTITVSGSLDASTAPELTDLIHQTLNRLTTPHAVHMDLRQLQHLAAAGGRALIQAAERCHAHGVDCYLIMGADDPARTVLTRLQAPSSLRIVEDVHLLRGQQGQGPAAP
ncbi:hypothetical protein ACWT_4132 [Actinoplanes sp. SE50]|uniref:STAS domain-containing protein n=1 Tax=unclassified Actinoplanes TaxID=2626549 RepID=UPI00023EBF43|nr:MULTISPECIES: STAS domain-containing protein [unclassified Actinoplanes]AEV85154.1 uncharacterized protein ACPL_4261 [Actinoplanes sp. SE50/110]ATO83547.1 hypothetical protein ACWT_4132 [Actinoplanes sp. SE50]SLM00954.1 anti-anti-sigma factor [Actinoplanes sp. SE50/110]